MARRFFTARSIRRFFTARSIRILVLLNRRRIRWLVAILGVSVLLLACVLIFPSWLYPSLHSAELVGLEPVERVQAQAERLKLQNDVRTTLLQGCGWPGHPCWWRPGLATAPGHQGRPDHRTLYPRHRPARPRRAGDCSRRYLRFGAYRSRLRPRPYPRRRGSRRLHPPARPVAASTSRAVRVRCSDRAAATSAGARPHCPSRAYRARPQRLWRFLGRPQGIQP